MYTQCPECSTTFRVTADVLRQAAGKVRCGGCGNAFNALEYLSESKPGRQPAKTAKEHVPELRPEPLPEDGLPVSISAEQSAALLKTLDELAGSDIHIEDTGVEWRVLDDDEVGEAAGDDMAIDVDVEDQPEIDEILEDSPTPVDQFLTNTPPQVDSPEIFAEEATDPSRTPVEELRFDDNTPLPDDFDFGNEVFAGPAQDDPEPEPEPKPKPVEASQVDLELSEPDEWTDILDEFEDIVEDLTDGDDLGGTHLDAEEDADEGPLDVDTQFALQAEAMGIDLSGMHETVEAPVEEQPDTTDRDEDETAETDIEEDLDTLLLEKPDATERNLEDLLEEEIVEEVDEEPDHEADNEFDDNEANQQLELIDETDDEPVSDAAPDDEPEDEPEPAAEFYVPPMTEEEQTINIQIDQDLLAIAVEDEDGFASTMVLAEGAAEEPAADKDKSRESAVDEDPDFGDMSAGFETIIMEGEFVRSEHERDKLAADAAAAAELAGVAAAEREAEKASGERKINYGMVAVLIVLVLVLAGQIVHQSRHTLATIPAFNDTVGPLYRAIGQPLSPDWDITGWRFEATRGSADEALTIFSRIGNNSDQPLPYPLISVSLTDRFEETIGNRVLDPAEYLSNDLDPRKLVAPGNTFNAAITIQSPADEATGFKLNVCYREYGSKLRCAIDDFK